MKTCRILIFAAVVCHDLCTAAAIREGEAAWGVNPIRKVVNLLEDMLKKTEAEGEEEKKLHEAAMCACKKGIADLDKTIAANTEKAPGLASKIKEQTSSLAKLREDLKNHKGDVAAALSALEDARGSRKKELKVFTADSSEKKGYIASLGKALPALRKGMNSAASAIFLQTESALAASLRSAAAADSALTDGDRDAIMSFLSNGQSADQDSEAEGSGEIIGIISSMLDDYKSDLAAITTAETAAASLFEELENAKTGEIKSLRTTIQKKTERAGNLAVDLVVKKNENKQSDKMLAADQEMLGNLKAECSAKGVANEKRIKTMNEEIQAIHDTVKVLSSGDALDTFKSSLPASSAAFIQLTGGARAAAAVLRKRPHVRPELRFLELALMGKKVDFTKVTKLIDDMIALTGKEQVADDAKKKSCRSQLQKSKVKAADLGRKIKEQTASQDDRSEKMRDVVGDIKSTKGEIVALDTLVKDAQKERKAENAEFQKSTAGKTGAKEILEVAKKRMDAFYNKPEAFLATEDAQVDKNPMPTQDLFKVFDQRTPNFIQTDIRRSGVGNKVLKMLAGIINDLSLEMATAKGDEEASQASYEKTVSDSAKKRAVYVKNLNSKENIKADYEQLKTKEDNELGGSKKAMAANKVFDLQIHKECDWLIQNFALRKKARAEEADSLAKAKAVLSGGDFSLLQTAERHAFLAPRS